MTRVAPIVFGVLLAACQPAFINGVPNEESPQFEVPVTSRLVLTHAITVPAEEDSAYFQRGKVLLWYDVSLYDTWCVFKLSAKSNIARTVRPDTFTVEKIWHETRTYLAREAVPTTPIRLAMRGGGMSKSLLDFEIHDGRSYEVLATVMQLGSPQQPDVIQLVCADWGIPQGGQYLTVRKIRHALGDSFNLEIAGYTN